jgi:CRISPR-associated protein (TIGR03984 family)
MSRTAGSTRTKVCVVPIQANGIVVDWLTKHMKVNKSPWLLATTSEGIVWGELRDDGLHFSADRNAFPGHRPARLEWDNLENCRCFGPSGELFVWRGPQGPAARLRRDGSSGKETDYIDETYQLWGEGRELSNGFVRLIEGEQGITHCPPLHHTVAPGTRAILHVRHYLEEDTYTGILSIVNSRLLRIEPKV